MPRTVKVGRNPTWLCPDVELGPGWLGPRVWATMRVGKALPGGTGLDKSTSRVCLGESGHTPVYTLIIANIS